VTRVGCKSATTEGGTSHWDAQRGALEAMGMSVERVTQVAHEVLGGEVIDETGLTSRYDFDLNRDGKQPTSMITAIREQLGLELVEVQRKVEHLVGDSVEEIKTW
jgi:uncharacterized protein (TIGR03435 family)